MARYVSTIESSTSATGSVRLHGRLRRRPHLGPERHRGPARRRGAGGGRVFVRPRRRFAGRDVQLRYVIVDYDPPGWSCWRRAERESPRGTRSPSTPARTAQSSTTAAWLAFGGLGRLFDPVMQRILDRVGARATLGCSDGTRPVDPLGRGETLRRLGARGEQVRGRLHPIAFHARRRLFDWAPLQSLQRLDGKVAIVTRCGSALGLRTERPPSGFRRLRRAPVHRRAQPRSAPSARAANCPQQRVPRWKDPRPRRSLLARGDRRLRRALGRRGTIASTCSVLNAGALTHAYTVTDEGNETTLATRVRSPFPLNRGALRPLLEASAPSRVIESWRPRRHVHRAHGRG